MPWVTARFIREKGLDPVVEKRRIWAGVQLVGAGMREALIGMCFALVPCQGYLARAIWVAGVNMHVHAELHAWFVH